MLNLLKRFLNAFLYDELAAKRWLRGTFNAVALTAAQVVVDPAWQTWGKKEWLVRMVPGLIAFVAGSITAGEKNPPVQP